MRQVSKASPWRVCYGWLVCGTLFGGLHSATAQVGLPPPQAPLGRAQGLTAEIEAVLRDMLQTYRQAEHYRDSGKVAIRQTTGRIRRTTEMPSSTAFTRPQRLQVVSGGQLVACDGETLQIVLDGLGQYTRQQAPPRLQMSHVSAGAPGGGLDEGYPEILEFLLGENIYQRWLRRIRRIEMNEPANLDGRPCHVITYESVYRARVTMYVDKELKLLAYVYLDITRSQDPPNAPPRPAEQQQPIEIQYRLAPLSLNEQPPEDTFAITTPSGMRLVKAFRPPDVGDLGGPIAAPNNIVTPPSPGAAMVGQPVPTIQVRDLNGETFLPHDLKGKVSLLFLWTPDGGPDCLRAIHMVQRVADRFASSPKVQVLGICGQADRPDVVRDLLRLKKAQYRTLLDEDELLMREFKIESLPMFFLVSEGKIQFADHGAELGREQDLAEKISQLLRSATP